MRKVQRLFFSFFFLYDTKLDSSVNRTTSPPRILVHNGQKVQRKQLFHMTFSCFLAKFPFFSKFQPTSEQEREGKKPEKREK